MSAGGAVGSNDLSPEAAVWVTSGEAFSQRPPELDSWVLQWAVRLGQALRMQIRHGHAGDIGVKSTKVAVIEGRQEAMVFGSHVV